MTLIDNLLTAVPPGKLTLTSDQRAALVEPTRAIVAAAGAQAHEEYRRFQARAQHDLQLDPELITDVLGDRTLIVTGGTGCIGTALLKKLVTYAPARIVSLSRGVQAYEPVPGVEYLHCDVRDLPFLSDLVGAIKPDYIFNLAAQHDPGLAEREVARTYSTNVGGTANLIEVCRRYPDIKLVHASTGKALRPFTPDVYAASKKMAETLLLNAASEYGVQAAAVRFTHVMNNSIVAARLRKWTRTNRPIRLHSAETAFYVQSAAESCDLLITAALDVRNDGRFTINAIRDLDWPMGLLDLAIGYIVQNESQSPIYVCGHEQGYEADPYPGLYDPRTSAEISPLLNALESYLTSESLSCPAVDSLTLLGHSSTPSSVEAVHRLIKHALNEDSDPTLRAAAQEASWAGLEGVLQCYGQSTLQRHERLLETIPEAVFSEDDRQIRAVVLAALAQATPLTRPDESEQAAAMA